MPCWLHILLPSLNQAREIANQTVCLHMTHQWALGLVFYDGDYGSLPLWGAHYPPGSSYQWSMGPYMGYNMEDYWQSTPPKPDFRLQ